ncbi:MAG: DUF1338 family protein [Planctomycetota bacterium]
MRGSHPVAVQQLLEAVLGPWRAGRVLRTLAWPRALPSVGAGRATRSEVALALAALLLEDVLARVPYARLYVTELMDRGERLVFDHGALRTVAAPCGALPTGAAAIARVLEPLGYGRAESYDLSRLGMTGHAYRHADLPEDVPQFFVSELHPERFSDAFGAAVQRVVGASRDPLSRHALVELDRIGRYGWTTVDAAARVLPEVVGCFDRQHAAPSRSDYEHLLAESAEMAWIATEGNAFNHATDRVEDVHAVAARQAELGRPIKDRVEVSASGRVLQTALRAAPVERLFRTDDGGLEIRTVPGSFHEFITRRRLPDGTLDLAFDAGNATSIFSMTRGDADGSSA